MEMGEKINKYRIIRHMTLEDLGEKVGVGKSTVRKWENGMIANMRRDKIEKVANALGISAGYLMGWTDDPDFKAVEQSSFTEGVSFEQQKSDPNEGISAEYQMLNIIYNALTKENRTKIVGIMQQMLMEQKGMRNDD